MYIALDKALFSRWGTSNKYPQHIPAGTWRLNNVGSTSMQRHVPAGMFSLRNKKKYLPDTPSFQDLWNIFWDQRTATTTRYICKSYLPTSNIIICIKITYVFLFKRIHPLLINWICVHFVSSVWPKPMNNGFYTCSKQTNKQFTKCTLCHTALSGSHCEHSPR